VLHVVGLATDQTAQVKNNTLSFIPLAEDGHIGVLESRKFLLVALTFTLKFLGNLLLQDKSLESIITLFLGSRETSRKTSCVILLLVNETSKTSVLTLMILNLDLEVLSLFS
jgi:hypothetical protein